MSEEKSELHELDEAYIIKLEEERDAIAKELREVTAERDMYKFNWELERGEIGMIPEDGMVSLRSKCDEHNPFENAYIDERGWIHDRKKWIEDNCNVNRSK